MLGGAGEAGKDCSLILKYHGGKIKRHKAVAHKLKPGHLSSFQAEKIDQKIKKKKKKNLEKLLSYHQRLVDEKGLPPSKLMMQHTKHSNEQFKCDQCEFQPKILDHLKNHKNAVHKAQNF